MTIRKITVEVELNEDPKYLYRYRPFNAYSLSEIVKDKIWFSNPKEFNDPFELSIDNQLKIITYDPNNPLDTADLSATPGGKEFLDKVENLKRVFFGALDEIFNKTGIVCFSTRPDHHLMWSHYANSHKGFCIEYERDPSMEVWKHTRPVEYEPNRIKVLCRLSTTIMEAMNSKLTESILKESVEKVIYTKHDVWAYEDEWRLCDQVSGPGLKRIPAKIKSIIYGKEMSVDDRETIWSILKDHESIQLKECISNNQPDFSLKVIDAIHYSIYEPKG